LGRFPSPSWNRPFAFPRSNPLSAPRPDRGLPSAQYPAVWAAHFGGPGPIGQARGGLLRNVGVTAFSEVRLASTRFADGRGPCRAPRRSKKAARERSSSVSRRRIREETDGQAYGEDRPRRRVLDRAARSAWSPPGPPTPPRGGPGRPLQPLAPRHRGSVRSDVEPAPGELAGQRAAGGGRSRTAQAERRGRLAGLLGREGSSGREDRFAFGGAGGADPGWAALPATLLLRAVAGLGRRSRGKGVGRVVHPLCASCPEPKEPIHRTS
jgi:hypothetical protein